ncbi:MAG: FlgD immunoglobulin-like domain containing protein [Candidatus Eisenbacteria bacterium]
MFRIPSPRPILLPVLGALVIFLFAAPAAADDTPSAAPTSVRGMTNPAILLEGGWEAAPDGAVRRAITAEPDHAPSLIDRTWDLIDSRSFTARLPAGEAFTLSFVYPGADTLVPAAPGEGITAKAWQAIDYAPDWMHEDLRDVFRRHAAADQDTLAGLILAAVDPIVDEVAFTVAHTAPEVLSSPGLYYQMIVENAEDVYAFDPFLDYVEIVDYGSAAAGGDYYSTTQYYTAADRGTTLVELPRERYYWDIVHPKITDEFPTYIDPADGDPSDPPVGRFWREFLLTHADSGFTPLADYLAGIGVLWEGNVDSQTNGAVGEITRWILDVLDFGSGAERPIQPVRIYRLHLGRCGEHADITCGAARAALIPCNSASAPDEDHTWNEFWDRRWVAWEPVNNYVDSGWHYEGWGKSFMGIFDWRGDGWTWTVTERYTPACTLTVEALDSLGYPVDGAIVRIGISNYVQSCWGYTGYDGRATFILGDVNDIFGRIDSPAGSWPAGGIMRKFVTAAVADTHYTVTKNIFGARPSLPVSPMNWPTPTWDTYRLHITWNVDEEIGYGGNQYATGTFADRREGGTIEFFVCDEENFAIYQAGQPFWAYEITEEAASGDVDFVFPTIGSWHAVISNEEHLTDKMIVSGTAELYYQETTNIAAGDAPARVMLGGNRPNPFNPATTIDFTPARKGNVTLAVYDVAGRLVRTLVEGVREAGPQSVSWDGTDGSGRPAAGGVYFARLNADGVTMQRKMVLVK